MRGDWWRVRGSNIYQGTRHWLPSHRQPTHTPLIRCVSRGDGTATQCHFTITWSPYTMAGSPANSMLGRCKRETRRKVRHFHRGSTSTDMSAAELVHLSKLSHKVRPYTSQDKQNGNYLFATVPTISSLYASCLMIETKTSIATLPNIINVWHSAGQRTYVIPSHTSSLVSRVRNTHTYTRWSEQMNKCSSFNFLSICFQPRWKEI